MAVDISAMLDFWIRPISERRSLVIVADRLEQHARPRPGPRRRHVRRQVARGHPLGHQRRPRGSAGRSTGPPAGRPRRRPATVSASSTADRQPLLVDQRERLARVLLDDQPPAERGQVRPGGDHAAGRGSRSPRRSRARPGRRAASPSTGRSPIRTRAAEGRLGVVPQRGDERSARRPCASPTSVSPVSPSPL